MSKNGHKLNAKSWRVNVRTEENILHMNQRSDPCVAMAIQHYKSTQHKLGRALACY